MKKQRSSRRKKYAYIGLVLVLIALSMVFLPKYVLRYFYWNFADIRDNEKFPKLDIKTSNDNTFYFAEAKQQYPFSIPGKFDPENKYKDFDDFLEDRKCVAFLLIQNDTLLYENYFDGYDSMAIIPSFSVAKSFVSALTGIAIDEGYIYSVNQSITFFLKELGPEFNDITIENLLNMRSGIKFNEGYNTPFADMPKYYYGTDLKKYIKKLKIEEPPGIHYNYISVNTLLLSLIVERATNTKLNVYLEKKLWKPMGMESDASWSIDSEKNRTIKAFCCLNATARDFAKFGRLYLHHGNWQGRQLVPADWVKRSTSIINDSRDSQNYPYTYQWRVLENGAFFAKGILGQYIFVYPEKNVIGVRMGKDYGDIDWAALFMALSNQL